MGSWAECRHWEARSLVGLFHAAQPTIDRPLDKSSTKIKPKAAPRRAPASSQTSARASVDLQVPSQTPQPQPIQQDAVSTSTPAPSEPEPTTSAVQQATIAEDAAAQNLLATAQNADLSGDEELPPVVPRSTQKRPRDDGAVFIPLPSARAPPSIRLSPSPAQPSPRTSATPAPSSRQPSPSASQDTTGGTVEPPIERTEQPATKRRRIEHPQLVLPSVQDAAASPDRPAYITEPGEGNIRTTYAAPPSPQASQIYSQPICESAEPARSANKVRKSRTSAKAKGKQRAIEDVAAAVVANAAHPTKKKMTNAVASKSKTSRPETVVQSVETAEEELEEPDTDRPKKKRKRKKRSVTPEDAEDYRLDPTEVRMSELTKPLRTGRKSQIEMELQEMDAEAQAQRRQRRIDKRNGIEPSAPPESNTRVETAEERLNRLAPAVQENVLAVPDLILDADGNMVVDETSLQIDRHARAAAEREAEPPEIIEENDLTRRVNAGSWLKRDKSGGWNTMYTDQFYDGLRMFGTDFNMISKMFPGRSRHSVKLKFNKEEREDPLRVERALKGERLAVDMAEFQKAAGMEFSDPKELEREMEEDRRVIEEEQAALKAAMDEVLKERADEAAREAEALEKENRDIQEVEEHGKRKKKRRKAREKGELGARQRNKAHNKATMEATQGKAERWKSRDVREAEKALAFATEGG